MSFRLPKGTPPPPALSREEEAALALNSTRFARGAMALLLSGFVLLSFSGIAASSWELFSKQKAADHPSVLSPLLQMLPSRAAIAKIAGPLDFWRLLPTPESTRAAEKALEERSSIAAALRPRLAFFPKGPRLPQWQTLPESGSPVWEGTYRLNLPRPTECDCGV
jgi:hypothetical protein